MPTSKTKKEFFDTVIISDIHLGSSVSRPKKLLDTLETLDFHRLILLGDVFDDMNFHRLNHEHWNFLSYIRTQSDPIKNKEIIWIYGNHDQLLSDIKNLLGIEVLEKYKWTEPKNKKCLAIHGHQFDRFLIKNTIISAIASWLYLFTQKIDRSQHLSRILKKWSKGWLRLSDKVANGVIRYAQIHSSNITTVFCGHTHQSMNKNIKGVEYYNTGCWTDIPSSYITIKNGDIVIHLVN